MSFMKNHEQNLLHEMREELDEILQGLRTQSQLPNIQNESDKPSGESNESNASSVESNEFVKPLEESIEPLKPLGGSMDAEQLHMPHELTAETDRATEKMSVADYAAATMVKTDNGMGETAAMTTDPAAVIADTTVAPNPVSKQPDFSMRFQPKTPKKNNKSETASDTIKEKPSEIDETASDLINENPSDAIDEKASEIDEILDAFMDPEENNLIWEKRNHLKDTEEEAFIPEEDEEDIFEEHSAENEKAEKQAKKQKKSSEKSILSKGKALLRSNTFQWVASIAVAVLIALTLRLFVFELVLVNGSSMETTLSNQERLYMNKLTYRFSSPQFGDVVIITVEQLNHATEPPEVTEKDYVKRIIGISEDHIAIENGSVYRNGERLIEEYAKGETTVRPQQYSQFAIPEGYFFVLGDNRENSRDSREFGLIHENQVKGRASLVLWPLQSFGRIR